MTPDQLQQRTKEFSLRVIRLASALPLNFAAKELGRQLVRSGMSVSANYRAARRARSKKEFVAKIGVVAEESDETAHWLDLLIDSRLMSSNRVQSLKNEADELMRIFSATYRTARVRLRSSETLRRSARKVLRTTPIAKSPDRQIAKWN